MAVAFVTGRTWSWWRSPEGQPAWARPALLVLTVIAGLSYAWGATGNLEIYYAAAVRSMSMSWHNFFFAAFDPAATISLDKLPGAFWVQALSVRVFGVHAWAIVGPQVLEGMASVLVLYRVVCRLSGPLAGILAGVVLVLSPATVALNRGNIADTLMVLLLLLAADATVSAVISGRLRSLVWAGVLIGLAFQAKMIEAWVLAIPLALAFGVGARTLSRSRRLTALGVAGLVTAAVSLAWMLIVSLWPAGDRPYVDGSHTNSIFSQVFVYNGFGRVDQLSPDQLLTRAIGLKLTSPAPGWDRLLTGAVGRDAGWLIPAALISLGAGLIAGRDRNDLLRVAYVLWGAWLVVLLVVFSAGSTINAYYTAALSPAIAGLLGTGLATAYRHRADRRARLTVAAAVAGSCAYAAWLLPGHGIGLVAGIAEIGVALGLAAVVLLTIGGHTHGRTTGIALALVAVMTVPAAASASIVSNSFGPFDTPFEPATASRLARTLGEIANRTRPLLAPLQRVRGVQPDLMATQTAAVAAPFIYDSGQEVLPIGGFTGTIPEPTLDTMQAMIAHGDFHLVIQAPVVTDPRLLWVQHHCLHLPPAPRAAGASGGLRLAIYYCRRPRG